MGSVVLVTDFSWPALDVERAVLAEADAELVVARSGSEAELCELARSADAVLTCFAPVTAAVLQAAPRCVTVARYGVGLDNIDVAAATRLGVVVSNVPDFCTTEVADHTMALVLAVTRQIVPFAGATSRGIWDNRRGEPMHRLGGRVFGLVGYGRIAREVARRAQAFGYEVIACSPSNSGTPPADGVRFVPELADVLSAADVVSLHLPLTPATRHILGAAELARMKPGAILVNTARGALVDQQALASALRSGSLAGAGVDVLESEPPAADDPLLSLPSVIVTPHAAFVSAEATAELQQTAARNVAAVLRGQRPAAIANPQVLASPALRASMAVPT